VYEEIINRIIALLKANTDLAAVVKEFYFGERAHDDPRIRYPHVWVALYRDTVAPFTGKDAHDMEFYVTIVQRVAEMETALKFVLARVDHAVANSIPDILHADPTLNGNVTDSYVRGDIILDWIPAKDNNLVGARLTLYARVTVLH